MAELIFSDSEACVGCNRCVRVCPIEGANRDRMDDGKISVEIDTEKCIACGACIQACRHEARSYRDDTQRFLQDLARGKKISMFMAPAGRANHASIGRLLSWLRKLGVRKIFDVSLGADICTWAHIRFMQKEQPNTVATQPCPAIVSFAQKHDLKLMNRLSPIHSPMLCTAIYMQAYEGIEDSIAALSPCIAKKQEFEDTGRVEYNVTFQKLLEHVRQEGVTLPETESGFDHYQSALGGIYSMPGGLKENVEFFLGKSLRIDRSEGQEHVYEDLKVYSEKSDASLPAVFDVLNCAQGCNSGTGCSQEQDIFAVNAIMDGVRKTAGKGRSREYYQKLYRTYDQTLKLSDFLRSYEFQGKRRPSLSDDDLETAFLTLGKASEDDRIFDCGACGSDSCRDMARKIALGYNLPENCIEKSRADIEENQAKLLAAQKDNEAALSKITRIVERVRPLTRETEASVTQLHAAIESYGLMAKAIDDIASQIKIISFNASIEAARSGTHGRAFGVVATEIRALAQKTKTIVDSTNALSDEASQSIEAVSQQVRHAVGVLEER